MYIPVCVLKNSIAVGGLIKNKMEKVDIVLSIYNPDKTFLVKQLQSLNNQSWENIEIIIYDDCIKNRCDTSIFEEVLTEKKWRMLPYKDVNLQYTKAFEELVRQTDGEYVAFCDQDDIWDRKKIEKCVKVLKEDNTDLVATDRSLIDKDDKITCPSVRHYHPKPENSWNTYDDIGKYNFFVTYAVGMSMVMRGDFVRSVVPFSKYTGHDKWVLACASACNGVSFLDEVLVSYRRHGNNVSGVLRGISSKKEYVEKRAVPHLNLIKDFIERFPNYSGAYEALDFAEARVSHDIIKLFKYRYLARDMAKFEIALAIIPNFLFKYIIQALQKRK